MILIILLFHFLTFFANSLDNNAGVLKLVLKCLLQLFNEKFSNLSFSNKEALLTRQSKNFSFDFANLIIFFISLSLLKSPLTR